MVGYTNVFYLKFQTYTVNKLYNELHINKSVEPTMAELYLRLVSASVVC